MLRASTLGEDQFNKFVDDRLVKGTVRFLTPIKRNYLKTGIIKPKKIPKAQTIMKEDCHAFGVSDCCEGCFPSTRGFCISHIANPDQTIRQSDKSCFRNILMESSAMENEALKNASWFIDGMPAARTIKLKNIHREWLQKLITFAEPPNDLSPTLVGFINDTYREISTRKLRETRQIHINGLEQHMPQGLKSGVLLTRNNLLN